MNEFMVRFRVEVFELYTATMCLTVLHQCSHPFGYTQFHQPCLCPLYHDLGRENFHILLKIRTDYKVREKSLFVDGLSLVGMLLGDSRDPLKVLKTLNLQHLSFQDAEV